MEGSWIVCDVVRVRYSLVILVFEYMDIVILVDDWLVMFILYFIC